MMDKSGWFGFEVSRLLAENSTLDVLDVEDLQPGVSHDAPFFGRSEAL
jgi:hypothetical protein